MTSILFLFITSDIRIHNTALKEQSRLLSSASKTRGDILIPIYWDGDFNNFLQKILKKAFLKHQQEYKVVGFIIDSNCNDLDINPEIGLVFKSDFKAVFDSYKFSKDKFNSWLDKVAKKIIFLRDTTIAATEKKESIIIPDTFFSSGYLDNVVSIIRRIDELNLSQFSEALDKAISLFIKNTKRPKRKRVKTKGKYYEPKYFIDSNKMCFEYGFENHGFPDTGGLHNRMCVLKSYRKFGLYIERSRHFNVTKEGATKFNLKGRCCHGSEINKKFKTHANIFPNGYVK